MSEQTLSQIMSLLEEKNISYEHLHHETIGRSSEEASSIRGTEYELGAKALVLQTKSGKFIQAVLPAHLRTSLKKLKSIIGEKNISLADPADVQKVTDCIVGSVPPMGVLWNISVYVDPLLLENEKIVFSAGTLEDSIFISPKDLATLNKATIIDLVAD